MSQPRSIVLAYSGGLDTSIIIPWLKERYGAEVHAVCGDVGQGPEELEGLEAKAAASGAESCRVVDLKQELVTEGLWPMLRALAVYEGRYLLGTSIARPFLSKAQVEYAREVGADAVAHGCTGKGNDQVRFELGFQALAPDLQVIAPWRMWDIESREDALDYADRMGIQVTASREKIYSRDRNLWHISHEGGELEDPGCPPPEHVWTWTADPRTAPEAGVRLRIGFEGGVPVSIDGKATEPVALIEQLNAIAAEHGVGRIDIVENRLVGMKSRGLYETPAGTVLYAAAQHLRQLCLDVDSLRLADRLALEYADLVYTGRWFCPVREALDACFDRLCVPLNGEVQIELRRGQAIPLAAVSGDGLYSEDLATFGASQGYRQADAEGFIRLYGLPSKVAFGRDQALLQRKTQG